MGKLIKLKSGKGKTIKISSGKPFKIAKGLIGVTIGLTLFSAARKLL